MSLTKSMMDSNGERIFNVSRIRKLRQLLSRRDKLYFLGLLGLMLIAAFFEMVGVGAIPVFVAALAVPERVLAFPIVGDTLRALDITTAHQLVSWGSVALLVVYTIKTAFLVFVFYAQARTTEFYRVQLADRLFSVYMNAPYEFHLGRNSAELQRNVNIETNELLTGVIRPILSVLMASMMTLFIIVLLLVATPSLALLGVTLVGGGSWFFMRSFRRRLMMYGSEAQAERRDSIKILNQALGSYIDIHILGREKHFIDAFRKTISLFARANRFRELVSKTAPHVLELIAVAGMLLVVLGLVIFSTAEIKTIVPVLALYGAAVVRLKTNISTIVTATSQIRYSIVAVDPLFADITLLKQNTQKSRNGKFKTAGVQSTDFELTQEIKIDHLSYTYPGAVSPAIRDVNLVVPKGTSIGIVGSTGSGKTTLINLLIGLLRPEAGGIYVDGVDIHSNLRAWQNNIGYVPQNIYLLDDSIKRNIAFGLADEEIDEDRLRKTIQAAQLEEFVAKLGSGLDTQIGERGVRISGGQRQRIGLARALYHNPDILIMDEATSSLDSYTENLVMSALENLKESRTLIMIAHRLSTVQSCDRLYLLKDGQVVDSGTYEELCQSSYEFRRMTEMV